MRISLIFLFSLFSCTASAQPTGLLHKSYAEKYYYADSLVPSGNGHAKDSFFKKIEYLKKWAEEKGDLELAIECAAAALREHIFEQNYPDSLAENEFAVLDKVAAANNLVYAHAHLVQLLGVLHWKTKHNLAIENYIAAYKLYAGFSPGDFPQKREYIYKLGTALYIFEDYEQAIKYLIEALDTKPCSTNDYLLPIYNTIGLCYRYLNSYDSSNWYFQKIYDQKDPSWWSITAGNMGINKFYQKKYDEAVPLLLQDIDNGFKTNNNIRSVASSVYILSVIYCERNELDKAEGLLKRTINICESKPFWPDYMVAGRLFSQLHKVYSKKGNATLGNLYADSALTAKDSFQAQYNFLSLAKAREKNEFIEHKLETEKLLNQKNRQSLIRNCLVAFIFLLMVIGVLFINWQTQRQKKLKIEKDKAEHELTDAMTHLNSFRQSAQEKNVLIEQFTTEIERIRKGEESKADNEMIAQLEQSVILTDQQWDDFRILFEKVHAGFFAGLKKKMPDLTQSEIRFLALTKLNLNSKEMAAMLGISTASIRTYRYRLRKKFDFDKDDMLDGLVGIFDFWNWPLRQAQDDSSLRQAQDDSSLRQAQDDFGNWESGSCCKAGNKYHK